MDFSDALRELKGGNLMTREAWSEGCLYLEYAPAGSYLDEVGRYYHDRDADLLHHNLSACTVGSWYPTSEDLLAEDWTFLTPAQLEDYKVRGREKFNERCKEFIAIEREYGQG